METVLKENPVRRSRHETARVVVCIAQRRADGRAALRVPNLPLHHIARASTVTG